MILTAIMQGLGMTGRGAQVWIERLRNLFLDGQTKIWQGRCAEIRGELTTEQAAQRDVSRERAMAMLTLLRQRRGVLDLETPYQIGAAFMPKPRLPSWICPMQEYVDSLSFATLRRYIGALQKALHTSIAWLSPLKLARSAYNVISQRNISL